MRKILLNKRRSKTSINENMCIPVEINRNTQLFHDEIMSDTIDVLKLYNDEKDISTKHRFIFTIYPICSNSLFNNITEVIYDEGGDNAYLFLFPKDKNKYVTNVIDNALSKEDRIDRKQLIRNTEYSNNDKITYHCGTDIFNNHLLRQKDNVAVLKENDNNNKNCKIIVDDGMDSKEYNIHPFNTIGDYSRDNNGEIVKVKLPKPDKKYTFENYLDDNMPLYLFDDVKSFKESYNDNIKRKDGWMGFYNPSTLKIPVSTKKDGKEVFVNKLLNDKEACEFIEMSPEKDLFSFIPKKNSKRNRLEYNWEYCITYPSESIYEIEGSNILSSEIGGLPLSNFENGTYIKEYNNDNGIKLCMFRSIIKHNMSVGDIVRLFFEYYKEGEKKYKYVDCTIVRVGDFNNKNTDRYFSVMKNDYEKYITTNDNIIRFSKIVNGFECEYYFRKFSKINNKKINSEINKLAFAGTIYGDDITQIVFTDDIDIIDLKDNRNRQLTELYLTIVKTNKGHNEWYEAGDYHVSSVEYSHVFGKVTSGIDVPLFDVYDETIPIVRKQHNINNGNEYEINSNIKINKSSAKLEDDITIENSYFYGDLVEFNPISLNETVLEDVVHRVNTAQRETLNTGFTTMYYDDIYSDIYDYRTSWGNKSSTKIIERGLNSGYANLSPEGYIYKPHHKIKIAEFEDTINQLNDIVIKHEDISIDTKTNTISFTTNIDYSLTKNKKIYIVI